jgi:hypothetical protein
MKKNTKNAEQEFIDSAILHHDLSVAGDIKGSNRAHKLVTKAGRVIAQNSDEGRNFFEKTTKHENASVRLWAATLLLFSNESLARRVLAEIEESDAPWQVQATAEIVLDQWNAGTLKI